jgi:multiple antibiotic resistance protein
MIDYMQVFTFLFLMLGPFKVIGPFAKITQGADPVLIRKIAVRAILFSVSAILLAAFLGGLILSRFGIPLPILGISGGIILFLVALLNIIKMYTPLETHHITAGPPTLNMAINPLAFPTIVTPYGIAAVIVMLAYCPDLQSKLIFGAILFGIMALNLIIMLITRHIFKVLAVVLAILGTILGVVQVALGLQIIYKQFCILLKMG